MNPFNLFKKPVSQPEPVISVEEETTLKQFDVLQAAGKSQEAIALLEESISRNPNFGRAHFNLGLLLLEAADFNNAIKAFQEALRCKPDSAACNFNMGNAYLGSKQIEEALECYRQALQQNPIFHEAAMAMGRIYESNGHHDLAIAQFKRALSIEPELASAHCHLGNSLLHTGHFDAAIAHFTAALQKDPEYAEALGNRGLAHYYLRQYDQALADFCKALTLVPDHAGTLNNLGNLHAELGDLKAAAECYRQAIVIWPEFATAHSNLLFIQNYLPNTDPAAALKEAKAFGDRVSGKATAFTEWKLNTTPNARLRIGFVSGDLYNHPVGFFLESVLHALVEQHGSELEFYVFSTRYQADETNQRLRATVTLWEEVATLSDEALAHSIHSKNIHILVDLAGHTGNNRLPVFAWKPAPIQISWLGYCATTGMPTIDYYLADAFSLPTSLEPQFVENIWRLPETYICLSRPGEDLPISPLPALGSKVVTFGSFNNLNKVNETTIRLWCDILHAVPKSRLLLKAKQLHDNSVKKQLLARLRSHNIDERRVTLESYIDERHNHLLAYRAIDIGLDPTPYNGVTTTAEALWMGVPVITLSGSTFLSRQGTSLLMNAGLENWIAQTPEEYISLAKYHADHLEELSALRALLRSQVASSPIFNHTRFATHLYGAFREMWQRWCAARNRADNPNG